MRYCPSCLEEYEDSVKTCSECAVDVVTEEELASRPGFRRLGEEDPRDFVVVGPAEDPYEADAFAAALEEARIPALARVRLAGTMDSLTDAAHGRYWEILVPADQKEKAAELMAKRHEELEAAQGEAAEAAEAEAMESKPEPDGYVEEKKSEEPDRSRYCPSCLAEYEETAKVCSECKQDLVTAEELSKRPEFSRLGKEDPRDFVVVGPANDPFEADAFTAAINEAGIPVMARMRHGGTVDSITATGNFWDVLVPVDQVQKAAEVMARRREELIASEGEAAEAAEAEAAEGEQPKN
ncbi:MAG TPA: hypothetical protein VGK67_02355 [Myxococcales bacterium]|jgi:hypothetical protein